MNIVHFFLILFSTIISSNCFSQVAVPAAPDTIEVDGKIFERVEVEASYPGGVDSWQQFLINNANASVATDNGAPVGRYMALIQFIVGTDGNLTEFKPLTKMGYGMEQEVIRILKLSGPWSPAIQNGKPIKAYRKQPLTFSVEADYFSITSSTPFILFTGIDNEIIVQADKEKASNFRLTISQGTIKAGADGKYIVQVNKPGRVVIILWNDKKNKEIGASSFEVKEK
jgi:hypothetical protein